MSAFSFFAGANSEDGFVSYYTAIDSDAENSAVFNIVGGPGTGKSFLMKKLCGLSEKRGWEYEKYFCSSDPQSLDAVRLKSADGMRSIVVCDATAPHPRELSTPGAVGRVIDLTQFWSCDVLSKKKELIMKHQTQKSEAYRKAYEHLKTAGALYRSAVNERKRNTDINKLYKDLRQFSTRRERAGIIQRPTRCISMLGEKALDNKGYGASKRYFVKDMLDCAIITGILRELVDEAWIAPDPIVKSFYNELCIPSSGVCFSVLDEGADDTLCTDKYRICGHNDTSGRLYGMYLSVKELAVEALSEARVHHFKLEELYGAAMDFEKKDKYDESVMKDVSAILQ